MKKRLSLAFQAGKDRAKRLFSFVKEKLSPYTQRIAKPLTKWGRKFERSFFATTSVARVFRKTLFIAGVSSGVGFTLGAITTAAFLATAKVAAIVAGVTWGREALTRVFTDKKDVTWKNEIGQEIQGTKIQKQKLTATQTQINRLTDKFNPVSGPTEYQQKKLKSIVAEMKDFAKQVTIKSAPTGIAKDTYVFAAAKRDWTPLN